MNSRNKQQNDIMYNLNIEFGIHGINNGDKLVNVINEFLSKSGDTVRVVGCSIKKPTARVDLRPLYNQVVEVNDDEIADCVVNMFDNYVQNLNRNITSFSAIEKKCNSKEAKSDDKESD